jgi:predicted permease
MLGKILVSAQVALSLVLVMGATLFVRSLETLRTFDAGFRRESVLMIRLFPQPGRQRIANRAVYYRQLAESLSRLPGVEGVSYSHMGPLSAYEWKQPVSLTSSDNSVPAMRDIVGPGFFHLIGMRFLTGREFEWSDNESAAHVAIISESLARRLFGTQNPIGRKIRLGSEPEHQGMEIVGVVNSASLWKLQSREPMAVYTPLLQDPMANEPLLDIRTVADPAEIAPSGQRTLESLGYHYALLTRTLKDQEDVALTDERLIAMLAAFFGGLALLLASMGLYGLMSHMVTRRTSEIGIRMTLGAARRDVLWLVLRQAVLLVAVGIVSGVPVTFALTRTVSSLLYGLSPSDPLTLSAAVLMLFSVASLASYLPARRASRLDPMTALRSE